MKKPKNKKITTPLFASIVAGVLVIALFLVYILSSGWITERRTGILLPSEASQNTLIDGTEQFLTIQSIADVEITENNAQKVIASLVRPAQYSCKIGNKLYFSGGSSELFCRRYVDNDIIRTDTISSEGEIISTVMRKENKYYAWNKGELSAYQGIWGELSDDAAAMLPTYEDVLSEDISITKAGRLDIELDPCIRVEFEQKGYRCVYDISAASGLLKQASFYQKDTLVRQVKVSDMDIGRQVSSHFMLPNGKSILEE